MSRLLAIQESTAFRWLRSTAIRLMPWISLALGLWSAFGFVRRYEQAKTVAWMLAGAWLVAFVLASLRWWAARRRDPSRWIGFGQSTRSSYLDKPLVSATAS